ncbi:MFS transporter, FHS family, L-fucose permease [Mariniphaga anaerophila]|uniref:MFS transporter, FHS family, L-fucose permease n=1 Tax=Mariniphaga anaerophila TaxID=1484053 RepID=A0A1M4XUS9_9BACT|nr:MFS transporter [Mariniphaga anaerophila]SHE97231.1 MFS transporter, FHS family, L-fucose permease [Mariniphaga anaerophila]
MNKSKSYVLPIIMMILLFGMISFVTNLAAPMGIVLKNQFNVPNSLGMLGNLANFIAYAVMGIPGGILLQKVGYKKTALIAIAIGFVGVGIQYLSGHAESFGVYLLGAFIAGFSMCLLNIVVNPMLNTLGGEGNTGNQLIQVGGSFNSVMATFTPVFVGILIGEATKARINDVFPIMYIAMGVFALVFFILWATSIPEPHSDQPDEPLGSLMSGALKFRHFVLGAVAIFVYVGVEVGTPGIANLYMTTPSVEQAQAIVAAHGNSQAAVSEEALETAQRILDGRDTAGLGIATGIAGGVVGFYWLLMLVGRLFGAGFGHKISSRSMLSTASFGGLILVLLAIFWPAKTMISMPSFSVDAGALQFGLVPVPIKFFFLALVGLCTSIMWGSIFNLAVEGLGKYLAAASGIFMVLVCGGGILPAIQGWVADVANYEMSYWVIVAGLGYLLFYGVVGSKVTKRAEEMTL